MNNPPLVTVQVVNYIMRDHFLVLHTQNRAEKLEKLIFTWQTPQRRPSPVSLRGWMSGRD